MSNRNIYLNKLWYDLKHLRFKNKVLLGLVLAVVLFASFLLGKGSDGTDTVLDSEMIEENKIVDTASVRSLSLETEPLRLLGTVSAKSEANIRTEAQGQIKSVSVSSGQRVRRGQVIARIDDSSQRAAINQAKAALSSSEASAQKLITLTDLSLESAKRSLVESRNSAFNTLNTSLIQVENAVRSDADNLFVNADTSNPRLLFIVSNNQQLGNVLENERREIGKILIDWSSYMDTLTADDVTVEVINLVEDYAKEVRGFLSNLVLASSGLQSSETVSVTEIAGWKNSSNIARSSVSSVIDNLARVKSSTIQAETTLDVAEEESEQAVLGANTTSQASLEQAKSALKAAEVNLSKTLVVAPIGGIISRLDIEVGDFVSILESVAQISNDSSLEIVVHVAESERDIIEIGSVAYIGEDRIYGEIIEISPTLNLSTQKVEVKILPLDSAGLTEGQSVRVSVERSQKDPGEILIPLTALKVVPEGFATLFVSANNTVEYIPVDVGPVMGGRVLVYEGLSLDTEIIRDVRGIKVGDVVTSSTQK